MGSELADASWESLDEFRKEFPLYHLEDNVLFEEGASDTSSTTMLHEQETMVLPRRSSREKRDPVWQAVYEVPKIGRT